MTVNGEEDGDRAELSMELVQRRGVTVGDVYGASADGAPRALDGRTVRVPRAFAAG